MPASATFHALCAVQAAKEGARDRHLATLLSIHPDLILETWTTATGTSVVDLIRVPEELRRRGYGTMLYRAWECTLPLGTLVELFAVDHEASAFWRTLGFEGPDNCTMRKTVGPPAHHAEDGRTSEVRYLGHDVTHAAMP